MSKPADFLLGVSDFFAVILPGAVATFLVKDYLPEPGLANALSITGDKVDAAHWAAFLISSYVLGHFVFMLSSNLDTAYDRWRQREKPPDSDRAFRAADDLRRKTTPDMKESAFSTLKWAKSYIEIHCPHARLEIDRLEADQKFFRSLVLIAVAGALHFLLREQHLLLAATAGGMAVLAFHRYCDQRWKMTELTYATVVILDATGGVEKREKSPGPQADD